MNQNNKIKQITKLINEHYPLTVESIAIAPRGFAADTFYVNSNEGSYFLKIMHRGESRQQLFKNGLRVVNALIKAGIDFIPFIIPTKQGSLYIEKTDEMGSAVYAIYERLNAVQTYDYDRRDAFEKLAEIYKVSYTLQDKNNFYKETFHDGFIEGYRQQLESFWKIDDDGCYDELKAAKQILTPYKDSLAACANEAMQVVMDARKQQAPFYLTHSDYPGNVMVDDSGNQYIIDFDECLYGPLERDGWMTIVRENEESRIWDEVMRRNFDDYSINHSYIRFFVYDRFMIDLRDFLKDLHGNPDEDYRKKVLSSLKDYLIGSLYPVLLRYRHMDL